MYLKFYSYCNPSPLTLQSNKMLFLQCFWNATCTRNYFATSNPSVTSPIFSDHFILGPLMQLPVDSELRATCLPWIQKSLLPSPRDFLRHTVSGGLVKLLSHEDTYTDPEVQVKSTLDQGQPLTSVWDRRPDEILFCLLQWHSLESPQGDQNPVALLPAK